MPFRLFAPWPSNLAVVIEVKLRDTPQEQEEQSGSRCWCWGLQPLRCDMCALVGCPSIQLYVILNRKFNKNSTVYSTVKLLYLYPITHVFFWGRTVLEMLCPSARVRAKFVSMRLHPSVTFLTFCFAVFLENPTLTYAEEFFSPSYHAAHLIVCYCLQSSRK